jgi:hypothetical protein
MNHRLVEISESTEIERLERMSCEVIAPSPSLNVDWLTAHNCVAVPVESACHFDWQDAEHLAQAIKLEGVSRCFAICAERLEAFPGYLSLGVTREDLLSFSEECAHFNFLLMPAELSFAVLCTVYDYFVVAGTKAFVETATGCTIAEASRRFREYADDDESGRLLRVARYYESLKRE